ncbi:MAG: MATE family efflux transporter [Oscillospiraceae bacterium]|jgi:putative MATE family efflux protein|nr:MATE family efflux transporter [Oscillospiraceae bacterium]
MAKQKEIGMLLTKGNVTKQLIIFSIPFLLSNIVQSLYNAADMYMVGQFASTASVSGVTIGGQIHMLIVQTVMGLCVGGTIMIAQYKGAEKGKDVNETISTLLTLLGIASLIVTAVVLALNVPILKLIKTPEESFSEAQYYFNICILGTPFVFGYNAISGILRGMGDSKRPLVFVSISCLLNVGLDLLLVKYFAMGAAGAAIATIVSQAVSLILSWIYLRRSNFSFDMRLRSFKMHKDKVFRIFKLGTPSAIQSLIVNSSFVIMSALVNFYYGVDASAGVGISGRINSFAILPALAIGMSVSAMVAQNYGAWQLARAKKTMWVGIGISFAFCAVMFTLFQTIPDKLIGFISDESPKVVEYGVEYMKACSYDLLVVPFVFCATNFVNGIGKTTLSMISNMLSAVILRVPIAILFSQYMGMGLEGIGYGVPLATVGTSIILMVYIMSGVWHKKDKRHLSRAASGEA